LAPGAGRTRSTPYTLFALSSTALVAEVAESYDSQLFDYTVGNRYLEKAVNSAAY
jgi:hypothetical protein